MFTVTDRIHYLIDEVVPHPTDGSQTTKRLVAYVPEENDALAIVNALNAKGPKLALGMAVNVQGRVGTIVSNTVKEGIWHEHSYVVRFYPGKPEVATVHKDRITVIGSTEAE